MAFRSTLGWSLFSSGVVTLVLKVLPGDSLWWGLLFLAIGLFLLYSDASRR